MILPDTAKRTPLVRDEIYSVGQGHVIWKTSKADSPAITAAAREELEERQRQERMRLLYVAMTRAESWLIVCAAGDTGTGEDSWYGLIDEGMGHAGDVILPQEDADAMGFGPVRRVEHGLWPDDRPGEIRQTVAGVTLPDWAIARAPVPPQVDAPLSPSGLGGAKVLPGEDALRDQQAALRYGSLLHLLLEHLPNFSAEEWPETAAALLQDNADLAEIEPLLAEVRACLTAPAMQGLLGPDALVEVEVTASLPDLGNRLMRGNIDRLVVAPDHVLAVDYKSNAVVPASAAEVPQGILRQMGAYAAALAQIYPGSRIDTAILWTRTAHAYAA